MMARALIVLLALGLVTCHRPAIQLPAHGVDVEVKVKVGREALEGGSAERCMKAESHCPGPCLAGCCRPATGG